MMDQLQTTSDVVCLFTKRSLERPWILFEAGVAKGNMNTPVFGLALGIPLSQISSSSGPFYQFQNMDDSEEALTKLVHQLARRFTGLELDPDVVKSRVEAFRQAETALLEKMLGDDSASVIDIGSKNSKQILIALKANQLREDGLWKYEHSPWADKGSCRKLWNERSIAEAIDYVINGQGDKLLNYDWW